MAMVMVMVMVMLLLWLFHLQVTYDRVPDVEWSQPYSELEVTVQDTGGLMYEFVMWIMFLCKLISKAI